MWGNYYLSVLFYTEECGLSQRKQKLLENPCIQQIHFKAAIIIMLKKKGGNSTRTMPNLIENTNKDINIIKKESVVFSGPEKYNS